MFHSSASVKIAAHDLDGNIITIHSQAKFPKSAMDLRVINSHVAPKFYELAEKGFVLVISTSQTGINNVRVSDDLIRSCIKGVLRLLKIDLGDFVATSKSIT